MLAQRIIPELAGADEPELAHDSSTNALIRRYRKKRARQRAAWTRSEEARAAAFSDPRYAVHQGGASDRAWKRAFEQVHDVER